MLKSLSNVENDYACSQTWHIQNILFNHFQGYLGIFSDIDVYSATLTGAQRGGRGQISPALF